MFRFYQDFIFLRIVIRDVRVHVCMLGKWEVGRNRKTKVQARLLPRDIAKCCDVMCIRLFWTQIQHRDALMDVAST